MQTWLVHTREPLKLLQKLGLGGFLTFQLIVGGNALIALAHPAFLLGLGWEFIQSINDPAAAVRLQYYVAAAAPGYCASAAFGFFGLRQRRRLQKASVLVLTPVHWLLLSAAAWCAAWELIVSPFRWRKTKHGLDKAARENERIRSLLELERHLTNLQRRGQLPEISG